MPATSRHRAPAPPQGPLQQLLPMDLPLDPRPPHPGPNPSPPWLPLPVLGIAPPTPDAVLQQARRIWTGSHRYQARYASFEALLAEPLAAKVLLTCARAQLVARSRAACSPFRHGGR